MPIDPLEAPFTLKRGNILRVPGNFVLLNSPGVIVKKAVGAATQVTLPKDPRRWQMAFVKDGKGDAATNNITVVGADGELIDGQSSLVIETDYASVLLVFDEDQWSVLASSVAAAPPTIAGFSPTVATAGMAIVITGSHFSGATAVTFNGVAALWFWIDSASQITAIVPVTLTGAVAVETPGGAATGASMTYFAGPLSVSSAAIWGKASGVNFQDSTRLTPDNIVASPVGSFTDLSGNAKHPAAALTLRPLYQTPTCFADGAVAFDGVNNCLQSPVGVFGTSVNSFTLAVAARFLTTAVNTFSKLIFGVSKNLIYGPNPDNYVAFGITKSGNVSQYRVYVQDGVTDIIMDSAVDGSTSLTTATFTLGSGYLPHVFIVRLTVGGTVELWRDGALIASKSIAAVGAMNISNKVEIGSILTGTTYATDGNLNEIAAHAVTISDAQLAAYTVYLQYQSAFWPITHLAADVSEHGVNGVQNGRLLLLSSGELIRFAVDGPSDGSNAAKGYIQRSPDLGVTWSARVLYWAAAGFDFGGDIAVQRSDGAIVVLLQKQNSSTVTSYSTISLDGALTFTQTNVIPPPSGYSNLRPFGTIRTEANGTLVCAFYATRISTTHFESLLMQSTDGGVTWTLRGVIAAGATRDYSETDAIPTSDANHWFAICRREDNSTMEYFYSTDAGVTWGAATVFSPGNQFVQPSLIKLSDGAMILCVRLSTGSLQAYIYRSVDNCVSFATGGPYTDTAIDTRGAMTIIQTPIPRKLLLTYSGGGTGGFGTQYIDSIGEGLLP